MFKVSFKENPQFPVKKVQRFNDDRVTVVTLKGVAQLPVFLQYFIPHKIFDWIDTLKNIDIEFTMSRMYITVTGKSICSKEDKVDKILGERIAEARAKLRLYSFMKDFTVLIIRYFVTTLFGADNIPIIGVHNEDTMFEASKKYARLYKDEQKHLNILLGKTENEVDKEMKKLITKFDDEFNTESSQEH